MFKYEDISTGTDDLCATISVKYEHILTRTGCAAAKRKKRGKTINDQDVFTGHSRVSYWHVHASSVRTQKMNCSGLPSVTVETSGFSQRKGR